METYKILTIIVEVDEGNKTPIQAYNEILDLLKEELKTKR